MLMSMKRDARKLQSIVQEELRRRAVAAIHGGMRQVEAAEVFGVARKTVWQWLTAYTTSGDSGLAARKRGPKPAFQVVGSIPGGSAQCNVEV